MKEKSIENRLDITGLKREKPSPSITKSRTQISSSKRGLGTRLSIKNPVRAGLTYAQEKLLA